MTRLARAALAATMALGTGALGLGLGPAARAAAAPSVPTAASVATAPAAAEAAAGIPAPVHRGTLRISGTFRDGATVTATGLSWRVPRLPDGVKLVSFEVAYQWQSCAPGGKGCRTAADSTATPFAARQYVIGHADTGRILRLTVTGSEVVVSQGSLGDFPVIQRSVTRLASTAVRAYPRHKAPLTAFVNGTPERQTASAEEYFQVAVPYANAADGPVSQWYRIDRGSWRAMPASRVLYAGKLAVGPHHVAVRTANGAGATTIVFGWRVVPMPAPAACRSSSPGGCWYPPHLDKDHHPMRWDWQIGRVTPLQRTGRNAVDIYDLDGFLTTRAQLTTIKATWQAATLPHPRAVCYLDLAWEDYRPDGSPGRYFPPATLGLVYFGFPAERWVDFRQLGALEPMLRERISMCARKGFDTVELDDIDSFDPPSTTGFDLTPGDVQNYLAFAFNEVHRHGMTALWKNSPYLSWWGRHYTDGAVVEECYVSHACFAAQFQGSRQYGLTCTAVRGSTPCGWDAFTTDVTSRQPTGKWVGETEYAEDGYVCDPGQRCPKAREFATFCRAVYSPPYGFTAMKLDANLDGGTFYPCPG
jgi:hypothetical protein